MTNFLESLKVESGRIQSEESRFFKSVQFLNSRLSQLEDYQKDILDNRAFFNEFWHSLVKVTPFLLENKKILG